MREVLGLLALSAGGFFVYAACLLNFLEPEPGRLLLSALFALIAAMATVAGKWLRRIGWRHAFGLTLFWGGVTALGVAVCFACLWFTPQLRAMLPLDERMVAGYRGGGASLLACLLLGGWLWRSGLRDAGVLCRG